MVRRAGDVVPEIVSVVIGLRDHNNPMFSMPATCPVCGSPVVRLEDEAAHRCTGNLICPAQLKTAFFHYGQRNAMNIDGFGESIIDELVDKGLLKDLSDIYRLKKEDLMTIERMGEKSSANILKAIEVSKHTNLKKFLYALGIRQVGEGTSLRLTNEFKTLDRVIDATIEELEAVEDIGPTTAESIFNFFKNDKNLAIVRDIENSGLIIEPEKELVSKALEGKTFVITGSFETLDRNGFKELIVANGGKVSGSVGKGTSYLLKGSGGGSKVSDAEKLAVPSINESEFKLMINNWE
jgi:DNA ligase (NAD+)